MKAFIECREKSINLLSVTTHKLLGRYTKAIEMFSKCLSFLLFTTVVVFATAYGPMSKENIYADVLLTELLNRMDKEIDPVNNYFDIDSELPNKNVDLVSRSLSNQPEEYEYRSMFGSAGNPSIRDHEYMQHSSLWGNQYISGGMGEVPNRYATIVKTDASLPAYCNPPNPCPYGYDESQGCLSDFENTAIFSREFQAAQECTCDGEHMFDCASQNNNRNNNEMTSSMEKFLIHQFQNDNGIENQNGVSKKFYGPALPALQHGLDENPFLQGEKLPIAAKKGAHIHA